MQRLSTSFFALQASPPQKTHTSDRMQGLGQDELFTMLTGEKFESLPPEKNDKNSIIRPQGQEEDFFARLTSGKRESLPSDNKNSNGMQVQGQEEDFFARLTSGKREALPSEQHNIKSIQEHGQETFFIRWGESFPVDNNSSIVMQAQGKEKSAAMPTRGWDESLRLQQQNSNSVQGKAQGREDDFFARLTSGKREALPADNKNSNSVQGHGQETVFVRWGDNNNSISIQLNRGWDESRPADNNKSNSAPGQGQGELSVARHTSEKSDDDAKMQQSFPGVYRSGRDESGDSDMDDDNDDNDSDGGEEETKAQREQSGTDYRLNFEATPFDNWLSDFDERVAEAMKNDPLLLFGKLSLEDDDHKTGPQIENEVIGTAKTEEERDGKEEKEGDSEKEQAKRKKEQREAAMRKKLKETPPEVQYLKNPPIAQASAKAFLGKEDD